MFPCSEWPWSLRGAEHCSRLPGVADSCRLPLILDSGLRLGGLRPWSSSDLPSPPPSSPFPLHPPFSCLEACQPAAEWILRG